MNVLLRALLVLASVAGGAAFHIMGSCTRKPVQPLQVLLADAEVPGAKVPVSSADASSAAETKLTATKVTVRVRSPSERASVTTPVVTPPTSDDEESMSAKVTIKAPAAKLAPPPPPPSGPPLTEAEELLLDATQRANCTLILQALQAGANPNVRDPKGRTPLHFMAGVGLAPAVVLLIHFGAQVNVRDADNLTPLHMAAGYSNAQTARVLIVGGADPTLVGDNQGTPLEVVCNLGDYQLKEIFAKRKGLDKLKKKDEKLEKLYECVSILDDPEAVREESNWDDMLVEVLKAIGSPDDD